MIERRDDAEQHHEHDRTRERQHAFARHGGRPEREPVRHRRQQPDRENEPHPQARQQLPEIEARFDYRPDRRCEQHDREHKQRGTPTQP
ncbi:hypothetical protein [Paraburkholderia sp. MM5384-R2]|uniref:hypothetical protein n=1 Tax=Paraburkholderia sp. MM5384-R2 TaxID=2723097 RepID=UPI001621BB60|nr:hypothetical protein [Paraburkholderia sp. MM5384-R2]